MTFEQLIQLVGDEPVFETGLLLAGDVSPGYLLWYLSDPGWPDSNLVMLNNALDQTGWSGEPITIENWRQLIWGRLQELDWEAAIRDVRPFLMQPDDAALLTLGNFERLLVE